MPCISENVNCVSVVKCWYESRPGLKMTDHGDVCCVKAFQPAWVWSENLYAHQDEISCK